MFLWLQNTVTCFFVPDTVSCFYVYRIQFLISMCTRYVSCFYVYLTSYLFICVPDTVVSSYVCLYRIQLLVSLCTGFSYLCVIDIITVSVCTGYSNFTLYLYRMQYLLVFVMDTVTRLYVYRMQFNCFYVLLIPINLIQLHIWSGFSNLFLCVLLTAPLTCRFRKFHYVLYYKYLVYKCVWYNSLSLHVNVPGTIPCFYIILGVVTCFFIPGKITDLYIYRIQFLVSTCME